MATKRKTTKRKKSTLCGVKDGCTPIYKKDLIKKAQEKCADKGLKLSQADIDKCVTGYWDAVKSTLKESYKNGKSGQITIPEIASVRVVETTKIVGRAKDSNGHFKKGSKGHKEKDTRISFTTSRYMEHEVTGKSLPKKRTSTSSAANSKDKDDKPKGSSSRSRSRGK